MYKIIGADGQQYGPVNADQVRRWIAEGRANGQTLAQPEGATDWKALSSLAEFETDLKPSLPPPPFIAQPVWGQAINPLVASRASNKLPAGIIAILLGGFGIHKFILGYTGAGLTMLLLSVLSCGIFYPVMHIVGLIEGIIYLSKRDEDFVRTYVDEQKPWF